MQGMTEAPSVRFAGFTDDWEQRKLENFLEVSGEKNFDGTFTRNDVLSVSGELGVVNQIEFQGRSFAGASVLNYGVVGTGDVVYTKSPLKTNPYGIIKTNKGKPGIVSTLYAVYHGKANVYPDFIQCYFEQDARANNYLHPLVNKGAKNDMKVSAENALKGIVRFPKYEEQSAIARFFSVLDHLLAHHRREYTCLCNIKKSMLERMFPQNGATVPEIRFVGFTDDWEQRKLSELIEEYKETVESNCELPVLTSSKTEGVLLQEEHFGRKQNHDVNGYNVLPRNYCTYRNRSDGIDFTFNINKCCDRGIISKFYPVFCGKDNDTFFISLVLNNSDDVVREIGYTCTGTGQKVLAFSDLLRMYLSVPTHEEQKKIAAYFDRIDTLITLHQRELERLKNIKKSCLEKMFV